MRAERDTLPRARSVRVLGFVLRVLRDVLVAVRRAIPAFAVVLRGTIFVVRAETFCVVVRGAVLVVLVATFFVLRVSVVGVVFVRSRTDVFAMVREGPVAFIVLLLVEAVGAVRDWVVPDVFCAVARDAARATSSTSMAAYVLQNASMPRHTPKSHLSPFIPLLKYASKIMIFRASRKCIKII